MFVSSGSELLLSSARVLNNRAGGFGGGVYAAAAGNSTAIVGDVDCTITSNSAVEGEEMYSGGDSTVPAFRVFRVFFELEN